MRWALVVTLLALAFAQASHAEGSYRSRQLLQRCPGSPGCPRQGNGGQGNGGQGNGGQGNGGFGGIGSGTGQNTVDLSAGSGGLVDLGGNNNGGSGNNNNGGGGNGFGTGVSGTGSAGVSAAVPDLVEEPILPTGGAGASGDVDVGASGGSNAGTSGTAVDANVDGEATLQEDIPVRPTRGNQGTGNTNGNQGQGNQGQGNQGQGDNEEDTLDASGSTSGSAVVDDSLPADSEQNDSPDSDAEAPGVAASDGEDTASTGTGTGASDDTANDDAEVTTGAGADTSTNSGGTSASGGAGVAAGVDVNIPPAQAPLSVQASCPSNGNSQSGNSRNNRGCVTLPTSVDTTLVRNIDRNSATIVEDILSIGDDDRGGNNGNGGRGDNGNNRRWIQVADALSRPSTNGYRGWQTRGSALVTAAVRNLSYSVKALSQAVLFAASPRDVRLRRDRLQELSYVQSYAFASARSFGRTRVVLVQTQLGFSWANSCYDNYFGVGDYMHYCYNSGGRYNTRNDLIGAHIYGCRQAYSTRVWSPYSRSFARAITLGGYNSYPYYYDVFTQIIIIGGNSRLGLIIIISESICDDNIYGDPYFGVLGYGLRTRRRETCDFYGSLRSDIRGRCGSRRRFSSLPIGIRSGFTTCGYNGW